MATRLHPTDPDGGYHRVICSRPFRALVPESAGGVRTRFVPTPVTCPACETDRGLQLVLDDRAGDQVVTVYCPGGRDHVWPEPAVDTWQFRLYSHGLLTPTLTEDQEQLLADGFGEEPPPDIDLDEVTRVGRMHLRMAKTRAKAAVLRPVTAAKRKTREAVGRAATAPFVAAGRALRRGAGSEPETEKPERQGPLKVPSVAKYRKAYGVAAPKRGPGCLVCEDTHVIPGTRISCTECIPASST